MSEAKKPRPKAIAMLSGGLDSTLALHKVKAMGFDVKAVNFYTGFCITETHRRVGGRPKDGAIPRNDPLHAAAGAETEIEFIDVSDEYVDVVTNPKYGYGAHMNPCIDCRIFMLRKAKEIMEAEGAEFVFTGEVVGQRPKSQRRPVMDLIEREAGLEGRLLRPLSGKHLPPTEAEKKGLLRREDLLDFKGRTRKPQMALARELGIDDYPQPAGGCCFLTDESYAKKFRDLLEHREDRRYTKDDIVLLSAGRHFRLGPQQKLVVSRNEAENALLRRYAEGAWRLEARDHKGPLAIFQGEAVEPYLERASRIVARYGKGRSEPRCVVRWERGGETREIDVEPYRVDAEFRQWMIA
ncbi:MAG: thiamine biosynthesis protein [Deltaproteobacteria bacterium]|nr:MAG: thiamine biosynthesis protein [Deltaproteobacteria bacterium]